MNLEFVAFESMGVRAQAVFIQTRDANIFVDPSAALAPRRYGLPPHIIEVENLLNIFGKIESLLRDSDVIVYTHYHYDHHDPGRFIDTTLYRGKVVFLKDPHIFINTSQRIGAHRFLRILNDKARSINIADGRTHAVGSTTIRFSNPLPHGETANLGYVIGVCIEDEDEGFMYTSDIEGGPTKNHDDLLTLCNRARVAVVDGPPTYLLGYRFSEKSLESSIYFLSKILELESLDILVLDHHICRDMEYREKKNIPASNQGKAYEETYRDRSRVHGYAPPFLRSYKERPI